MTNPTQYRLSDNDGTIQPFRYYAIEGGHLNYIVNRFLSDIKDDDAPYWSQLKRDLQASQVLTPCEP